MYVQSACSDIIILINQHLLYMDAHHYLDQHGVGRTRLISSIGNFTSIHNFEGEC